MSNENLFNVDWNECIYLYRTNKTKSIEDLLNNLYFSVLYKATWKLLHPKWYEYNDLISHGYMYFKEIIETIDYKNKNFIGYAFLTLVNKLRNHIRKVDKRKNVWNNLHFLNGEEKLTNKYLVEDRDFINEFYEQEIYSSRMKLIKRKIKELDSKLFEKIIFYKNKGLSCKKISKILNKKEGQIRGCWNYYRNKIIESYL